MPLRGFSVVLNSLSKWGSFGVPSREKKESLVGPIQVLRVWGTRSVLKESKTDFIFQSYALLCNSNMISRIQATARVLGWPLYHFEIETELGLPSRRPCFETQLAERTPVNEYSCVEIQPKPRTKILCIG